MLRHYEGFVDQESRGSFKAGFGDFAKRSLNCALTPWT
jgi:hypothetical protein